MPLLLASLTIYFQELLKEGKQHVRVKKKCVDICKPYIAIDHQDEDFNPIFDDINHRDSEIHQALKLIQERLNNIQVALKFQ